MRLCQVLLLSALCSTAAHAVVVTPIPASANGSVGLTMFLSAKGRLATWLVAGGGPCRVAGFALASEFGSHPGEMKELSGCDPFITGGGPIVASGANGTAGAGFYAGSGDLGLGINTSHLPSASAVIAALHPPGPDAHFARAFAGTNSVGDIKWAVDEKEGKLGTSVSELQDGEVEAWLIIDPEAFFLSSFGRSGLSDGWFLSYGAQSGFSISFVFDGVLSFYSGGIVDSQGGFTSFSEEGVATIESSDFVVEPSFSDGAVEGTLVRLAPNMMWEGSSVYGVRLSLGLLPQTADDVFSSFSLDSNLFGEAQGAVVPEASTWALLVAGFGIVGAAARRRTRSVTRRVNCGET